MSPKRLQCRLRTARFLYLFPPHVLLEEDIQPEHLSIKRVILDSEYIPVLLLSEMEKS